MKSSLREAIQQRWRACSAREQQILRWLGGVLLCLLVWLALFVPAQQTLRKAQAQRSELTQQWAQMNAMQTQAKRLQQRIPITRDSALSELQRITPATTIQLTPQSDRVLVNFKAVPADVLANWLANARTQAQALPTEAHLMRVNTHTSNNTSTSMPTWDGTMVLLLPREPSKVAP